MSAPTKTAPSEPTREVPEPLAPRETQVTRAAMRAVMRVVTPVGTPAATLAETPEATPEGTRAAEVAEAAVARTLAAVAARLGCSSSKQLRKVAPITAKARTSATAAAAAVEEEAAAVEAAAAAVAGEAVEADPQGNRWFPDPKDPTRFLVTRAACRTVVPRRGAALETASAPHA